MQLIAGDNEGEYVESAEVSTNMFLEDPYKAYEDRYSVILQEDDEKAKRTVFRLTVKGEWKLLNQAALHLKELHFSHFRSFHKDTVCHV